MIFFDRFYKTAENNTIVQLYLIFHIRHDQINDLPEMTLIYSKLFKTSYRAASCNFLALASASFLVLLANSFLSVMALSILSCLAFKASALAFFSAAIFKISSSRSSSKACCSSAVRIISFSLGLR